MKGFYHIWRWPPSGSCDQDAANQISFPYPRRVHIKFGFDWPHCFGEEDLKISIVDDYDGWTDDDDDGLTPDHEYPTSSPMSLWRR